jgi:molecular chaperone DnaK
MGLKVKNSPYILGIDLGTSNSSIAIFHNGISEIIPIEGEKSCPSVMHVRKDGEIVVGRQARGRMMVDPDSTVVSVKREIGTDWSKEFKGLPGKDYKPEDISAEILSMLVIGAQEAGTADLRGSPKYVVICIPANFNDTQKAATRQAGESANLDVLYLLEEPVAAAIAYATDRERDQNILVYDLGGGTFDVSILTVDSANDEAPQLKVLSKEGVPHLGGDDFDLKIMELAATALTESSRIDVLDLKKDQGISVKTLREAQQKLKDAAEKAKCELTEAKSAQIIIPNLVKDESGEQHHLDWEITREQFNDAVRELILQSREAIDRALSSAKMEIEDISRIILVGGSTKVPLVKEMLTEMFGKEPYSDLDPDTAVARGAAIFGATLNAPVAEEDALGDEDKANPIEVSNIVTHFLGIETAGGKFSCLIEKDLEIPEEASLEASKVFVTPRDNMTELAIRVYQSDMQTEFVGKDGVVCIGEFFLTGIPPKPRGQEQVTVKFAIDQQNQLKVTASSPSTSGELSIQRT